MLSVISIREWFTDIASSSKAQRRLGSVGDGVTDPLDVVDELAALADSICTWSR